MSEAELEKIFRIVDERRIALAQAEENLHIAMAARQVRRELRAVQTVHTPRDRAR